MAPRQPPAKPTTLAPSRGPVMCASCDYQRQVRGEWRGDVFWPASDRCEGCTMAAEKRKDER